MPITLRQFEPSADYSREDELMRSITPEPITAEFLEMEWNNWPSEFYTATTVVYEDCAGVLSYGQAISIVR
jgi:hypothetical protein